MLWWVMPASARGSWTPAVCRVALPERTVVQGACFAVGHLCTSTGVLDSPRCVRLHYPPIPWPSRTPMVWRGHACINTGVLDSRDV